MFFARGWTRRGWSRRCGLTLRVWPRQPRARFWRRPSSGCAAAWSGCLLEALQAHTLNQPHQDCHAIEVIRHTQVPALSLNGWQTRSSYSFRDLTPIAALLGDYGAFVVKADSPFQSWQDAVNGLKTDPESIRVAGGSPPGGQNYLVAALAFHATGVDLNQVDYAGYDGGGAAINFGNAVLAQKDPSTGEPRGVSVDLARELGRRLGVPVELVTFDAAGKVFEAIKTGAWDVAFLAIAPARATEILFTASYVLIEGTYLVAADSPLQTIEDVDRDGVRIAVGRGAVYDLYLKRTLKHAQLVRAATSPGAIDLFVADKLEAAAGVRQPLVEFARSNPGVRVIEGRFMAIEQAMGTPKGREAGAAYLRSFVEQMKATGFVAQGLRRSGQGDATVAPPSPGSWLSGS